MSEDHELERDGTAAPVVDPQAAIPAVDPQAAIPAVDPPATIPVVDPPTVVDIPPLAFGGDGPGVPVAPDGLAEDAEDPDDAWPNRASAKGVRLRVPALVLVGLLVAAGAFWGGAAVQRDYGTSSAGSSALSSLASRFAGLGTRTGPSGTGSTTGGTGSSFASRFGGTSTAAATGTISVVDGDTLYVTETSGTLVKVSVPSSAKVTRNAAATAASLKPGDTVVVEGSTAKDGTVDATSVTATAAGVGTTGGLGAFAGLGGTGTGKTGASGTSGG